ncbi:MAG: four-helix bundle copper-binding protein [Halomonas sp.]|nr:four-helix bundle copper-binding protein [Halomonas sp.]MBP5980524.1 four-helix bundle copper-binding protein [Halomonas sp.]
MSIQKFKECIEACNICAIYCDNCASSCLQEHNLDNMAECIRLDIQCAQICRLAVAFMAQNSEYAQDICQLCADICQKCGDECGQHKAGHCQECAQACHRCASLCASIVA